MCIFMYRCGVFGQITSLRYLYVELEYVIYVINDTPDYLNYVIHSKCLFNCSEFTEIL